MKLKHELWEDEGLNTFCLAGQRGDGARKLLDPNASLTWTVEAESHFEAMTRYHEFMGWSEYTTEFEWDKQPYLEDWYHEQGE